MGACQALSIITNPTAAAQPVTAAAREARASSWFHWRLNWPRGCGSTVALRCCANSPTWPAPASSSIACRESFPSSHTPAGLACRPERWMLGASSYPSELVRPNLDAHDVVEHGPRIAQDAWPDQDRHVRQDNSGDYHEPGRANAPAGQRESDLDDMARGGPRTGPGGDAGATESVTLDTLQRVR